MSENMYRAPSVEPPGADGHDWNRLRFTRLVAASSIPLFLTSSTFDGALSDLVLYAGAACMAGGLVAAATFLCPACGERFMRLRVIDYLAYFWFFKILFKPTCRSCGASARSAGASANA